MRNILLITLLFVLMLTAAGCGTRLQSGASGEEGMSAKSNLLSNGTESVPADPQSEPDSAEPAAQSDSSEQQLPRHEGPAPRYVSFEIEPEYSDYKIGETIEFRIKLTNEWNTELHIGNEPKLRVGPAMSDAKRMEEIAVPALADLTLEPGKSLNTTAEWKQTGKTGQYRVELGEVDLGIVRTSGGGQTFFVQDPKVQMMQQSIDGGGEITLPNDQLEEKSVFVLKRIELTDHETIVKFDIRTKQAAPLGFHAALVRNDDMSQAETALGLEQSENIGGIISGTLTFNPSTIDTKRMKLVFTSWDVVHTGVGVETFEGPWSMELPLK